MTWLFKIAHGLKSKFQHARHFKVVWFLIGLLLLLKITELGLNLWIRQALRQSLIDATTPQTRLITEVEWLSLADLMQGRIRKINLRGYQCRVGGVKLQQIQMDSDGFTLDLNVLLQEKQLLFKSIARTAIRAQIGQADATEYFNAKYPQYKPEIRFSPDRLQVTGETEAFENIVPMQLEGKLQIIAPKSIRFYPEHLQIANRRVAPSFLKFIGNQIPLEVTVMQTWPLQITSLTLREGVLILALREIAF